MDGLAWLESVSISIQDRILQNRLSDRDLFSSVPDRYTIGSVEGVSMFILCSWPISRAIGSHNLVEAGLTAKTGKDTSLGTTAAIWILSCFAVR